MKAAALVEITGTKWMEVTLDAFVSFPTCAGNTTIV